VTTIAAVPNIAAGTITLTMVKTTSLYEVLRTDANGTRPVRTAAGTLPSMGTTGTVTFTDHEPALAGPIMYQVGGVVTWAQFPAGQPARFTLPLAPTVTLAVDAARVTDYAYTRESSGTAHQVIGRPADPIIIKGRLRSRSGKLAIGCETYRQARELEAILETGHEVLFRQPGNAGADLYFTVRSIGVQRADEWWALDVEYLGVKAPAGDLAAAGAWDFADLAALPGETFPSIAQGYGSFVDLALNEPA